MFFWQYVWNHPLLLDPVLCTELKTLIPLSSFNCIYSVLCVIERLPHESRCDYLPVLGKHLICSSAAFFVNLMASFLYAVCFRILHSVLVADFLVPFWSRFVLPGRTCELMFVDNWIWLCPTESASVKEEVRLPPLKRNLSESLSKKVVTPTAHDPIISHSLKPSIVIGHRIVDE